MIVPFGKTGWIIGTQDDAALGTGGLRREWEFGAKRDPIFRHPVFIGGSLTANDIIPIFIEDRHGKYGFKIPKPCFAGDDKRARDLPINASDESDIPNPIKMTFLGSELALFERRLFDGNRHGRNGRNGRWDAIRRSASTAYKHERQHGNEWTEVFHMLTSWWVRRFASKILDAIFFHEYLS